MNKRDISNDPTETPERLAERLAYYSECDEIVDRATLAKALSLSPNRISELEGMGVLQVVSRDPIRFALAHSIHCYTNFRVWTEAPGRRRHEVYCE